MLECRLLDPHDTPLLVSLVRACYGDAYAHDYFYDANALGLLMASGKLFSAGAFETDPDGNRQLVAHMAVKLEYDADRTADNFAGMMLPAYRGKGLLMQLGTILFPVYERLGLTGLQTATVTHHAISQKISSNTGTVTCGCLLADSPGSNAEGLQLPTRMPILMQFYPFQPPAAREHYVPDHYQPLVARICQQLHFPVLFARAGSGIASSSNDISPSSIDSPASTSDTEQHGDTRRGTALLRFHRIGLDADTLLDTFRQACSTTPATYIDIPMTNPQAIRLANRANALGWFFGGIIFGRANTDFLRLQCCNIPPASSREGIVDAFSRELVADVLQDYQRIMTNA